jgi:hypothetical protein
MHISATGPRHVTTSNRLEHASARAGKHAVANKTRSWTVVITRVVLWSSHLFIVSSVANHPT